MARGKRGRDIDGVVLLDKPVGCSSNVALQRVRRVFDARKAGHTGSLDPLASGLLPICLGEATKVAGYLLSAAKHYRVTAAVGAETTTGDREGAFTEYSDTLVPCGADLDALVGQFIGAGQQIPPMYSALKRHGKRLYEHARAGEVIERKPRDIIVHSLTRIDSDESSFTLDLRVSSGTYVRTLVEDIARAWGGRAHVASLRRSGVGGWGGQQPMTPLADLEAHAGDQAYLQQALLPLSTLIGDWPVIGLDACGARAITNGQHVVCRDAALAADTLVRIVDAAGHTLGLGVIDSQRVLAPKRLFVRSQP